MIERTFDDAFWDLIREERFERRAQVVALILIPIILAGVVYAWLACMGKVPAAPWSPVGESQHGNYYPDGQRPADRPTAPLPATQEDLVNA